MVVGVVAAALMALQLVLAALYYLVTRRRSEIMLVDFYSYRPPDRHVPSACHSGTVSQSCCYEGCCCCRDICWFT